MISGYDCAAGAYDSFNKDINYTSWAKNIDQIIKKYGVYYDGVLLDLGCGTGSMTIELSKLGYDMIGIDISEEMLSVARERIENDGTENILLLCQDIEDFELYGTVDNAVSCLDTLNHLTELNSLKNCFKTVHNYLIPDGLFIFDMNTPYKLKTVFGNNDFILEEDGIVCCWQNEYDDENSECSIYFSVFTEEADGMYSRKDGFHAEHAYELNDILSLLSECGFEVISVFSDLKGKIPSDADERWYFTARCKK